jgi:curved DNA-binding protein CbpA
MEDNKAVDYYDLLQVSPGAEPETINRVFRMLAQRFHPDNQQTGDEGRFRTILEAYSVLSDPEKRAQYDVHYNDQRHERWRLVSLGNEIEGDFDTELVTRLTVLEALYTKRRLQPHDAGISLVDLEKMVGRPREHLEFTLWFLMQKRFITRDDHSMMALTVDGAEYLEESYQSRVQRKRLLASND